MPANRTISRNWRNGAHIRDILAEMALDRAPLRSGPESASAVVNQMIYAESELGFPLKAQVLARIRLESVVEGIHACVKREWPEAEKPGAAAGIPEAKFFPFIVNAFYSNYLDSGQEFEAEEGTSTLTKSLLGGTKNCYTTSAELGVACIRMGKPVSVIRAPRHVLISGRKLALETTGYGEAALFRRDRLDSVYPARQETGIEGLVCESYNLVGTLFSRSGKFEEALRAYNKALQIDPNDVEAIYNAGVALECLGRGDEALAHYSRALGINSRYDHILGKKAALLLKLDRFGEAADAFGVFLVSNPRNVDAWYNHGASLAALGRFDEASHSFGKAVELRPLDHDAWFRKGLTELKSGEFSGALRSFDMVLALEPGFVDAWNNKGATLTHLGRNEEALSAFEKALELAPMDGEIARNKNSLIEAMANGKR